ncbi:MAG: class I SAM-dependent methyltransferase [Sedimentisphaerales bacterium]|nr:class I SAM-dependent methyltransferase [Sedimentisphaerales bacterium]
MSTKRYNPNWVKNYFDDFADKEWDRLLQSPTHEVSLHVHHHYLKKYIKPGHRVLEIGPGPGRFTQLLAQIGATIVIADISPVQLKLNHENAQKLGFDSAIENQLELDMCDMNVIASESFDAVVCYGGPLSYVFEQRHQAINEIVRVTKHQSPILIGVMNLWGVVHEWLPSVLQIPPQDNWQIIESGDLCPQTYQQSNHNCHLFRTDELRQFLEQANLQVIEMSASNCLSAAWRDRINDIRSDHVKWQHLLDMEIQACQHPGCIALGDHLIAVAQKT